MEWVEVFLVFAVSHLVGDYLLQTDWQALHKRGGLSSTNAESRKALFSHVTTYTMAFLPALGWIGTEAGAGWAVAYFFIVFIPHLVQDDGRLLLAYMRTIKQNKGTQNPIVLMAVDQSFHMVILFLTAVWVGTL